MSDFPRLCIAEAYAPTAPNAVARRSVNGSDFAPVVKIFPVLAEQRQKRLVQVIKFK